MGPWFISWNYEMLGCKKKNNSVVARMAEECLKRCPVLLSGWGACRRSPGQQTAGPYWNSFWFIDIFLQVWFFSFIHYKVNFLCTHAIVLDHLLVIVWTVTTVYMALAFVPTIPCPCSASQSAGVSNCFWGWDVCEGGELIKQHDSRAVSQACSQSRKLGTNGYLFFCIFPE